ncbi:MAG: hypothetical protein Fur009_0130 [Candidatus Microgenomates bacterium]
MEQHPIPRQITTFEFKLIGFLTVKQFVYLLVFTGITLIVYYLTPVPILNYFFAFLVGAFGVAFVFVPINDRSMDIWIKNLIKRLTSPTQYTFKKENKPPQILLDISLSTPQIAQNYLDAKQKLNSYLASKNQIQPNTKKQAINTILNSKQEVLVTKKPVNTNTQSTNNSQNSSTQPTTQPKQPFITGVIKNYKKLSLGGILVYIKNNPDEKPLRILKTNSHGIFLSFNPLPPGEYIFEIKDPKQQYFFDTMKLRLENSNNQPIEISSKELL